MYFERTKELIIATIVDALVVTLGLDTKGMKDGATAASASLKKTEDAAKKTAKVVSDAEKASAKAKVDATKATEAAATKASKEAEARGKSMAMAFSKIRNEALALVGVFTAGMGIKSFVESTIGGAASLGLMSTNLNMSTEKLSAWQRAAERAGGTAEGMTAQLQESAAESAKAKAGEGTGTSAKFYAMGGDPRDLKDGNTFLLARSRIVADLYKTDHARAQLVASQMGISEQQFNLIKQGPDAILSLVAAQEKNSAITDKQAAQALVLKNAWDDMIQRFKVTGTTILLELMPVFEKAIAQFQSWADMIVAHKDDIKKWVDQAIPKIEAFVKSLSDGSFDQTAKDLTNMARAFGEVADSILKLIGLLPKLDDSSFIKTLNGLFGSGETTVRPGSLADKLSKIFNMDNVTGLFSGLSNAGVVKPAGTGANSLGVTQKLIGMGWTPQQAAGMAGSLQQESGLNPAARNKTSGAYGIGQWLGSRVQDFKNFSGKDLVGSSLDDQLAFMNFEMTKGKEKSAGDKIRATKTAGDAAYAHSKFYERPGDAEANNAQRQANAEAFLQQSNSAAAQTSIGLPSGARAAVPVGSRASTSTSSAETNINGPITIQTAATDADGIAKDFAARMRNYSFVSQANTGLA